MSAQGTLVNFLNKQPRNDEAVIHMTPDEVAAKVKMDPKTVRRTLYSLKQAERIDFIKDDSHGISGIKVIRLEPKKPGRKAADLIATKHSRQRLASPRVIRKGFSTPNLDKYAKAKDEFMAIANKWQGWGTINFDENPLAEEALSLRERLASAEEQLSLVKDQYMGLLNEKEAAEAKKSQRANKVRVTGPVTEPVAAIN